MKKKDGKKMVGLVGLGALLLVAGCVRDVQGNATGVDWRQVNEGLDTYERVKAMREEGNK